MHAPAAQITQLRAAQPGEVSLAQTVAEDLTLLGSLGAEERELFFQQYPKLVKDLEHQSSSRIRVRANRAPRPVEMAPSAVKKILSSKEFSRLSHVPERSLRKLISSNRSDDGIRAWIDEALTHQGCETSVWLALLGSRIEESLPAAGALSYAQKAYAHAGPCGADELHLRARFRLGLFRVWEGMHHSALEVFSALRAIPDTHSFQSRAIYWESEMHRALGNTAKFEETRRELWSKHPFSYHALVAGQSDPASLPFSSITSDTWIRLESQKIPELRKDILLIEALLQSKRADLAKLALQGLSERSQSAEDSFRVYVAVLQHRARDYIAKFKTLSGLFRGERTLVSYATLRLFFPTPELNLQEDDPVRRLILMSLIRQESAFDPRARSRAGALGLMQVMPMTGRKVAGVSSRKLREVDTNLQVGAKYFGMLLSQFDNDVELALASYNAGPHRVKDWLKRYPVRDRILFNDLIPFKETREYVAAIVRNYFFYRRLEATPLPALPTQEPSHVLAPRCLGCVERDPSQASISSGI
jgi:soluble lytic murein transglycosylase